MISSLPEPDDRSRVNQNSFELKVARGREVVKWGQLCYGNKRFPPLPETLQPYFLRPYSGSSSKSPAPNGDPLDQREL